MTTALILEKVDFLQAVLDPSWFDGGPGQPGPIYRTAIADYIVAEALRDIGTNLTDRKAATQLQDIGKELVKDSSHGLVTGWEEGDDICPPWPRHFGHTPPKGDPRTGPAGPDPVNPNVSETWLQHLTPVMKDVLMAVAVRQLASLTTSAKASAAMKNVGEAIVKGSSSKLFDDYCGTSVGPRVPPKPRAIAA